MNEQEREALPLFPSQLEALLGVYWQAGYDEGTGHQPEVDPNETLSRIRQEVRDYARKALATKAVPAGWKLVPVEPTTGMLVAGNHCQPGDYSAKLVWQSMLEAADHSAELSYLRPLPQDVAIPPAPAPEAYWTPEQVLRTQEIAAELKAKIKHKPAPEANPEWCKGCTPENCGGCATPAQAQQAEALNVTIAVNAQEALHAIRRVLLAATKAEAKPLTDEQIKAMNCVCLHMPDWEEFAVFDPSVIEFARAIERAHGIGASTKESGNG